MSTPTHYLPGTGVLLVVPGRWVLVTDPHSPEVLERLWSLLHRPDDITTAFATLIAEIPALHDAVFVDRSGEVEQRAGYGRGRVLARAGLEFLTLDAEPTGLLTLRVTHGMVPATSARLPEPERAGGAVNEFAIAGAAQGFIDGIPADILAASAPAGPPAGFKLPEPAPEPEPMENTQEFGGRPLRLGDTFDTGVAGFGAAGVFGTSPASGTGSTEHTQIARRREFGGAEFGGAEFGGAESEIGHTFDRRPEPEPSAAENRSDQPALGRLRLPEGELVPLDREVVVGRRAAPLPDGSQWPHLVHVGPEYRFVSRLHLQLVLAGDRVLARDLGSRGGTTVTAPGREPMLLNGPEPYPLEPGTLLELAGIYPLVFERP